jgi:hypothetical protein
MFDHCEVVLRNIAEPPIDSRQKELTGKGKEEE